MVKIKKRRAAKRIPKTKVQNGIVNRIKFTESYTSLILGAIVVLVLGILFISFAKGNKNTQTSSIEDVARGEDQKSQNSNTSSTYIINPGDSLWNISENIYRDGYKWVEIARLNKLENPGLIHAGNKLTIPTAAPITARGKSVAQKLEQNPQETQESVIQNNSITENTYTVINGDNLWNIAVRAYGDGFKWTEIAKANNLKNPDLIFSGNVFKIPR